jgi:two-component system nitrogen regulation sensor histidine kinase GlnL
VNPDGAAYLAFDQLATMVAIVRADGQCLFANAAFEATLGLSRRTMTRGSLFDWLRDAALARETVAAVLRNEFSVSRYDGVLERGPASSPTALPVHVIVSQLDAADCVLVELVEIEQQARLDREERVLDQALLTRELVRNLAHEIKNPLGGIRGAAQLLEMEVESRPLTEYTQVIIREADRLQALVDRLLAPHRRPQEVGDVNIHEVCERVRALIQAEFSSGLTVERDYDASLPEFRGDREQLIQALLNIAQNAAQALAERRAAGDALIRIKTRIARQVTIGKQRWRLALELHVNDNGPGVPESIRDRIFYPLVSGREGGSGLGLTLAQTYVQQHQGIIECDSRPGSTTFRIVIPLP